MVEGSLPIVFREGGSNLTNYNFYDVISGTGFVNFLAAKDQSGGILTTASVYSDDITTYAVVTADASPHKWIDLDFDVVINFPTTFKGILNVNVPLVMGSLLVTNITGYAVARLRKVVGAVETEIASGQGTTYTAGGGVPPNHEPMSLIRISLPSTKFNKGETLRLTIEGWSLVSDNSCCIEIAHDPKNRQSTETTTQFTASDSKILMAQMPVRID